MMCPICLGTGELLISPAHNGGGVLHDEVRGECEACSGTGKIPDDDVTDDL